MKMWHLHHLRGAANEQNELREHRLQGLADLGPVLPWALAAWVAVGNFFNFCDPPFPQLSKGPLPLLQGFLQNDDKCLEAGWCSVIAFHHPPKPMTLSGLYDHRPPVLLPTVLGLGQPL